MNFPRASTSHASGSGIGRIASCRGVSRRAKPTRRFSGRWRSRPAGAQPRPVRPRSTRAAGHSIDGWRVPRTRRLRADRRKTSCVPVSCADVLNQDEKRAASRFRVSRPFPERGAGLRDPCGKRTRLTGARRARQSPVALDQRTCGPVLRIGSAAVKLGESSQLC